VLHDVWGVKLIWDRLGKRLWNTIDKNQLGSAFIMMRTLDQNQRVIVPTESEYYKAADQDQGESDLIF
jgi:hypothetical protein